MFLIILRSRFGAVALQTLLFLSVATLTRVALYFQVFSQLDHSPVKLAGVFASGLAFDLAVAAYAAIPLVLHAALAPEVWLRSRFHRWVSWAYFFILTYALLFVAAAEWFFWDEFSARFNFIAVDYLIYTTEVVGNIRESYPLPLIVGGLAGLTALAMFGLARTGALAAWFAGAPESRARWRVAALLLAVPAVFHLTLSSQAVPSFGNAYNQELARNGHYSFASAYRENSLSYEQFYVTKPAVEVFPELRKALGRDGGTLSSTNLTDVARSITNAGPERRWNVIQLTIESLSASFLAGFGNTNGLTPNLDRLMREGLAFTHLYATGTRTVRGMEALTLCLPPTPGQSIVRRPHNDHLFTVGSLFRGHGYDTAFIYSGFGYFDNMNDYFAKNGYRVIDRNTVAKEDITYATVWGACDEDLYRWTMREADQAHARGQPFHHFVMTTSNHRPFGYPAGCIDLPPGHREGAVKYTDYAIGRFLEEARGHAWFTNTLFVVVGDHCASAAGKTTLPVEGYHIPALVWNPTLIQPRHEDRLCSQIDLPPTLFGLLNWSYQTRFYGHDVLRAHAPELDRAFISTYQKLGYLRDGRLAVLEPVRRSQVLTVDGQHPNTDSETVLGEAIINYQSASHLFSHGLYGAIPAH